MVTGAAFQTLAGQARRLYTEELVKGLAGLVQEACESAKRLLDKPTEHAVMMRRRDLVQHIMKLAPAWHRGMVGGLLTGFLNLKGLMPLGVLAIILVISGPSMILAWLKLRKRNLGPILDANGWAVNAKAKINVPFGASLTKVAALPPGAQRDLADPFAESRRPWGLYMVLLLVLLLAGAWGLGALDGLLAPLSPRITRSWLLHGPPPPAAQAPAPAAPTPPAP